MSSNHDETCYEEMAFEQETAKTHVFTTLLGAGQIERYDVYRCVDRNSSKKMTSSSSSVSIDRGREIAMAKIQIGKNLNGHCCGT